jgi:hypothetical protein
VASRRPHHSSTRGGGAERAGGLPVLVNSLALRLPLAANDNKAPLLLRVRRIMLFAMAALAIGWLFWVGLLR